MNAQQSTGAQGWMTPETCQPDMIFTKTIIVPCSLTDAW